MKEMHTSESWLERHISLHTHDDAKAEQENALTHFAGAGLALIALVMIFVRLPSLHSAALRFGMVVYGCTMLLLYGASGLYHHLPVGDGKRFCRILDHSNIYFLIAGTYTPILLYIGSHKTVMIAWGIWLVAFAGVAFTLVFWGRLKPLHVVFYLAMGWMLVFFWNDIIPNLPYGLMRWILAGGITYTLGVIFYANKKIPHYHAIWHLFCVGGSLFFFIGFWIYLT